MKQVVVNTFTATIYLGFKDKEGVMYTDNMAHNICRNYCDKVGLCVTITPTKFIYTNGWEYGCAIGLINYPRFPSEDFKILEHAIELAKLLKMEYSQRKVTIVTPKETIMLTEDE